MEKLSEGVRNFIREIGIPFHFTALFLTIEDCECFREKFYDTGFSLADELMDFKELKVKESGYCGLLFMMEYFQITNRKPFLTRVFMFPFQDDDVEKFQERVEDGRINLHDFYEDFADNPHVNMVKLLK